MKRKTAPTTTAATSHPSNRCSSTQLEEYGRVGGATTHRIAGRRRAAQSRGTAMLLVTSARERKPCALCARPLACGLLPHPWGSPMRTPARLSGLDQSFLHFETPTAYMHVALTAIFDPGRPLWEITFIAGLPGGRFAMLIKVHHCLVDGIAGMDILAALLDPTPVTRIEEPKPWTPAPLPSDLELLADEVRRRGAASVGMLRRLPTLVGDGGAALGAR